MEFPFGGHHQHQHHHHQHHHHHHHHQHHHHHHHRRDDDQEDLPKYPPPETAPPPPFLNQNEFARPPPPSYFQDSEFPPPPPPPPPPRPHYYPQSEYPPPPSFQQYDQDSGGYVEYPPPPQVTHVSHQQTETETEGYHHSFKPHLPSFIHHHSDSASSGLDLSNKPDFKVYCKAEPNFYLTIREGKVVLGPSDSSDQFQKWYKDEKYSTKVKDEEGYPCFALVNKASGQAMKHSIGATHPVQLINYNPDELDESILWTESNDLGDGYRPVRMVNNIQLNVDAFHGDKKSGGVHDGTAIVLWHWNKGDNQRWRITPH